MSSLEDPVGSHEKRDIELVVARLIKDLGKFEPPINLDDVRALLKLDLKYYSSADVGAFQEFAHRIRLAGKKLVSDSPIADILRKVKLSGLWLPDDRRILVDEDQPKKKHRWIEAHEIAHSFIPWHAEFLLGDNDMTLDVGCREAIEAEANFGAGQLLFLGSRFGQEARDMPPSFRSIQSLSARYKNSLTSTFWRFIEQRDPLSPAFGLISRHPRQPSIGSQGEDPVEHFMGSSAFRTEFRGVRAIDVYTSVARVCGYKTRGPVFSASFELLDANSNSRSFAIEGFCTSYALLTYGRAT